MYRAAAAAAYRKSKNSIEREKATQQPKFAKKTFLKYGITTCLLISIGVIFLCAAFMSVVFG